MKYELATWITKNTSWSVMLNRMSLDYVTAAEGEKAAVSRYSSQLFDY